MTHGKHSDAGRDWGLEEKGTTEDEMAWWHHWLDGCESEWTLRVGDGQGGLACCDSWGRKESDTTEQLSWTELKHFSLANRLNISLWLSIIPQKQLLQWPGLMLLQLQFSKSSLYQGGMEFNTQSTSFVCLIRWWPKSSWTKLNGEHFLKVNKLLWNCSL